MHNLLRLAVLGSLCLGMALSVFADSSNRWGNYRGVERPAKPLPPPQYRPPHQRPPQWDTGPHRPHPQYSYPQQRGPYVEYRYELPRHYVYSNQRQVILNSQFFTQYQGSQYIIDEGNEPKLPAPPRGYRWVLSSGYYQLVPVQ